MEELFVLLIVLAVVCLACGPIALIVSIAALNRARRTYPPPAWKEQEVRKEPAWPAPITAGKVELAKDERPMRPVEPVGGEKDRVVPEVAKVTPKPMWKSEKRGIARETIALEQRIGTRWVLIAGVITVIFAAGFFLKYAYDNKWIGPLGRVVIAAVAGLVALAVGELTRRRGYGIVARGVTALGFAILYAAVFSARAYYHLIGPTPAFVLAICVTAAAMLYAVSLNEVVVAVLSLLGGYLTPVIVSTGENRPTALFCYVLVLGVGAVLCAYYRKWRAVDVLAFAGTYILYTGWFEKFYRPAIRAAKEMPEQMPVALVWLGVFFAVYLALPILHGLVKKAKAQKEDVLLVLANAAIVFYYLVTILFAEYRTALAFTTLGLCAAHLVMMTVVIRRCEDDLDLRLALLVIGLFFLTIAVPLYLKMYAIAMAWAVEGVVLAAIGLRYRSIWTQLAGGAAFLLSLGQLLSRPPMHTGAFALVFNTAFGTWCFVAGALMVCHIMYRTTSRLPQDQCRLTSQVLYAAASLVLMAAIALEWYEYCDHNVRGVEAGNRLFLKGMVPVVAAFLMLLVSRPICPRGIVCRVCATILTGAGAIFTMIAFSDFYGSSFAIFANAEFGIVLVFVAAIFTAAWLISRESDDDPLSVRRLATAFALTGILVLWVLLTEEIYLYWYCRNRFAETIRNWRFLSHMYISVMWAIYGAALMVVGFWRNNRILRYLSLGLFALLLTKVFILDTSTVKSVYRIAAFFATGVTLVAVSYLYQFLKKRGFFEAMLAGKDADR